MKYLITICSFILFNQLSWAQEPGDLDPTFGGGDGFKTINFLEDNPERLFPLVVDDEDRILTTGNTFDQATDGSGDFINRKIIVVRLTPDGAYDSTFADGGHGVYDLPVNGEYALDMTMQGDEILICGYAEEELFVFRLKESGEIDTSFGNNGIVLLPWSGNSCYLTTDNDGNVYVAGAMMDDMTVAKLTPQGDLDNSFGSNGFTSNAASNSTGCDGVELDEEGNIFVFCSEYLANPSVVAFTPEGGPLISFSPTGKRTVPFPDIVFDVSGGLISSDGERLYVYGGVIDENMHCAIVAMDMQGNLVEEFDGDGILEEDFVNPDTELIYSIAENETGLFLSVVNFTGFDEVDAGLVQLDHSGTPVAAFDDNGVSMYNIAFQQKERPGEVSFQSDGSVVFCGNVNYDFVWYDREGFVARVRPATSINIDEVKKDAVKVYPNPASNEIFISLSDLSLVGESYKIYNSLGKLVSRGSLEGARQRVEINHLSPGLFHLVSEGGLTVRFIKE